MMTDAHRDPPAAEPIHVLLLEDSPADAELCLRALGKAGFELRAQNVRMPEEFLAHTAQHTYDLIVADHALPAWSGLAALDAFRRRDAHTPFVLISGALRDADATDAARRGATDCIAKDELWRLPLALRHAAERKRLRVEIARLEAGLKASSARAGAAGPIAATTSNFFATVAPYIPQPVVEFDRQGQLTQWNRAAAELAQSLGKDSPTELAPVEAVTLVPTALATGQQNLHTEMRCGGRTFSWTFFPVPDRHLALGYVTEVTDRQVLESQLRHSQRLESVGRLAAGVAHDFSNVLTVIQGHTGLLRNDPTLSAEMAESVQQVTRAAERAGKLTSQLLLFSRKSALQPRRLDLNEVLAGLSAMLQRALGEDITFRFVYAEGLPAVWADAGLIEQVVMNLAVNARDAMPRGGQLTLATSIVQIDDAHVQRQPAEARVGRFVSLSVTDTGCGMDTITQGRIFEPFFTTKEYGKGTGLGLATCYGIIKQHQGWFEVSSQLGQGSTFKIYLPPCERPVEKAVERPADLSPRGNETILVVEDEAPVRSILRQILKRQGYRILEAANGIEALAVWHQHQKEIVLLLTDVIMPVGVSGEELAQQFRAQKPALKVMFTSGYSPQAAGREVQQLEGAHFLPKPFDAPQLAKAVRQCLDS